MNILNKGVQVLGKFMKILEVTGSLFPKLTKTLIPMKCTKIAVHYSWFLQNYVFKRSRYSKDFPYFRSMILIVSDYQYQRYIFLVHLTSFMEV